MDVSHAFNGYLINSINELQDYMVDDDSDLKREEMMMIVGLQLLDEKIHEIEKNNIQCNWGNIVELDMML